MPAARLEDQKAAEVIERFAGFVRDSANRRDGRVVKQIGDGFMLVFPEPSSAVQCALDIEVCATGSTARRSATTRS